MLRTIKTSTLEIGMYVILPASWLNHPSLRGSFIIQNREDIARIIDCGIPEVSIDTARGLSFPNYELISHAGDEPRPGGHRAPGAWEPEKLIPDELKSCLKDHRMAKKEKAEIMYKSTVRMMERLFEDPKVENIRAVKKEIVNVVDAIIADDATARQMLSITDHDFYTYTHSVNVGVLSVMLSKVLLKEANGHNVQEVGAGCFLHDLGKTRVDQAIINKPGELTEEEMQKMRAHPYQGFKLLAAAKELSDECRIIAMQHHERDDGRGYPRRLNGGQINIYARLCSIADVYDALTAERSYKPRLKPFEALKVMKEEMINHFQKDLFECFVKLFN